MKTPATRTVDDPKLTTQEAAAFLGVKPATLEAWRLNRRHVIPYIRLGRAVRYRQSDLQAYVEQHVQRDPATPIV
jgi:excisionase family DNA binding protein